MSVAVIFFSNIYTIQRRISFRQRWRNNSCIWSTIFWINWNMKGKASRPPTVITLDKKMTCTVHVQNIFEDSIHNLRRLISHSKMAQKNWDFQLYTPGCTQLWFMWDFKNTSIVPYSLNVLQLWSILEILLWSFMNKYMKVRNSMLRFQIARNN